MRRRAARIDPTPKAVVIEALSHEGRGVARVDGKATFVAGGLPGEEVLMRYTERRGRHDEAVVVEILKAAPERVEPPCAHAAMCGGCSLQHMHPDAQRAHKQAALAEQLEHSGAGSPQHWLPPLIGPTEGYRHKARMMMRWIDKKGGLLIGFSERGGRKVTDIQRCVVLAPPFGERIALLRERLAALAGARDFAQLELAVGDDHAALVLRHMQPLNAADSNALQQLAAELDIDIYLQPGGPDSVVGLNPEQQRPLHYQLLDGRIRFEFEPLDFTQINPGINRAMVQRVLELLQPNEESRVLDLFCGLGNFSLPLALKAKSVMGIEGAEPLVARARHNAHINGISNIEFLAADLSLKRPEQPWLKGGFDRILIDPPRTGAAELLEAISLKGCERLVYVSCNPATLARDAALLKRQHGMQLLQAGIMDMFPHTNHVESMAVFEPA